MVNTSSFHSYVTSSGVFENLGVMKAPERYKWPRRGKLLELPPSFGKAKLEGSSFDRNVQLKEMGPELWRTIDHKILASWIVRDWGGIRGNQDATIYEYVERIERGDIPTEYKGVATYSKILGLIYPYEWCIYDARVAVSLNCIQLLSDRKSGRYFPYLPSQNTKINPFKKAYPKLRYLKEGWLNVTEKEVYKIYNDLLEDLMTEHNIHKKFLIEMALFIDAEELIDLVYNRSY